MTARALADEQWKAIPGWEGHYEVSDLGRVRSVDRIVSDDLHGGRKRKQQGRILAQHPGAGGREAYMRVNLHRDGIRRTGWVHRLVAEAFIGPRPEGMETCHNDGNGHNNRLTNLRYDTPSANALDAVMHGVHPCASRDKCIHGHPFDADNTYLRPDGNRDCRTCKQDRERESNARLRGRTPTRHGRNGYQRYGCRCDVCRAANTARLARYRASKQAREPQVA